MHRTFPALILAAALVAPFASSAGSYSHDDDLDVDVAAVAAADAHIYSVLAAAGDIVTVTVSWSSETADLDIVLLRPDEPSCALLPDPDAPCLIGLAADTDVACASARAPLTTGPASETVTFVAGLTETYGVVVQATVATPQTVAYHVDITVDGEGGAVSGPEAARFVGGNPACKLPLADAL